MKQWILLKNVSKRITKRSTNKKNVEKTRKMTVKAEKFFPNTVIFFSENIDFIVKIRYNK